MADDPRSPPSHPQAGYHGQSQPFQPQPQQQNPQIQHGSISGYNYSVMPVESQPHPVGDTNEVNNLMVQVIQGYQSIRSEVQSMETRLKQEFSTMHAEFLSMSSPSEPGSKKTWSLSDLVGKRAVETPNQSDLRLKELEGQREDLEFQVQTLKSSMEEDQKRIQELQEKIRHHNVQQASLREGNQNLRHMLTHANLDKDEPTDADLRNLFGNIRKEIQKLVNLKLDIRSAQPKFRPRMQKNTVFYSKSWPEVIGNSNATKLRLRKEIYEIIQEEIFGKPCFGIGGETETKLSNLEQSFGKACNEQTVAEWRKLTIQCIDGLNEKRFYPRLASDTVWDLVLPVVPQDKVKEQKIIDMVEEICAMAYDLAFRFRQSKSKYQVISIPPGVPVTQAEEEQFVPQGFENPNLGDPDIPGSNVAYTVFGAMVKFDYGYGEQVVLDNAQVVCKK